MFEALGLYKQIAKWNTFGQRSQNLQIRDFNKKLQLRVFLRKFEENQQSKREKLGRLSRFKQSLTNDQVKLLQDRQFVIIDRNQMNNVSGCSAKDKLLKQEQDKMNP